MECLVIKNEILKKNSQERIENKGFLYFQNYAPKKIAGYKLMLAIN